MVPSPSPQQYSSQQPRRSATYSSWVTLGLLLLLGVLIAFHPFFLRASVRGLLWLARPMAGIDIKVTALKVNFNKPITAKKVSIETGQSPYATHLELSQVALRLSSLWRLLFGDHQLTEQLQIKKIQGLLDLRTSREEAQETSWNLFKKLLASPLAYLIQESIPNNLGLSNISLVIMGENQRYSFDNGYCYLPAHGTGFLGYDSLQIEAGPVNSKWEETCARASWSHNRSGLEKSIRLEHFFLNRNILIDRLNIVPRGDLLDLSLLAHPFGGTLRADGNITNREGAPQLDIAFLGEKLPLQPFSTFLGLSQNISGELREGRFVFRGSTLDLLHAESSLNFTLDQFRWHQHGWAEATVVANYVNQHLTTPYLLLRQNDNYLKASGDVTLQNSCSSMLQSPFSLELTGRIEDPSQLSDLIGSRWSQLQGKLSLSSSIRGKEHQANGFLKIEGTHLLLQNNPLGELGINLQFQGTKTLLKNLSITSAHKNLQCYGEIENQTPYHYQGNISYNDDSSRSLVSPLIENFPELLTLLQPLENKNLNFHWSGHGSDKADQGSLDLSWSNPSNDLQGYCCATYQPEQVKIPQLLLRQGSHRLAATLSFTPQQLQIDQILFTKYGHSQFEGSCTLPFSGMTLFQQLCESQPFSLSQSFLPEAPLSTKLTFHYFQPEALSQLITNSLTTTSDSNHQENHQLLSPLTTISGKIEASGKSSEPQLQLQLHGENLLPGLLTDTATKTTSTTNIVAKNNFSINIYQQQTPGKLSLNISAPENVPHPKKVTLQGTIPIGLNLQKEQENLSQLYWIAPQTPLNLQLSLPEISLTTLQKLPPFDQLPSELLQKTTVTTTHGPLQLQGALYSPDLTGSLFWSTKKLRFLPGIILQNLRATLQFNHQEATLKEGETFLGQGKATLSGTTKFKTWNQWEHHYHLEGENLSFLPEQLPSTQKNLASSPSDTNAPKETFSKTKAPTQPIMAQGKTSLYLDGNTKQGSIAGDIELDQLSWHPKFPLFPYTIPPAIPLTRCQKLFFPEEQTASSDPNQDRPQVASSWDLHLSLQAHHPANASNSDSLQQTTNPTPPSIWDSPLTDINLFFEGDLYHPKPKGTITVKDLPLKTAHANLLADGKIEFYEIPQLPLGFPVINLIAHLSGTPSLLPACFLTQHQTETSFLSQLSPISSLAAVSYSDEKPVVTEPFSMRPGAPTAINYILQLTLPVSMATATPEQATAWYQLYLYSLFPYPYSTQNTSIFDASFSTEATEYENVEEHIPCSELPSELIHPGFHLLAPELPFSL